MRLRNDSTGKVRFRKLRRRFDADRMPRELTFSCYQRFKFLERERGRNWFREAIESVRSRDAIELWAYVLMHEHVHLILAPRLAKVDVGRIAGRIKERVARQAVAWLKGRTSSWLSKITVTEGDVTRHRFWQPGGGYDRNIDNPKTLQTMIDYIHQNPVRRGLAASAEAWEWSSARWFAGMAPVWVEIDSSVREALM